METVQTAEQFKQWASKRNIKLIPSIGEFSVGDVVTFTNDYGVKFHNLTIIGISADNSFYGRQIYTNTDSYWFPHKPSELLKIII